MVCTLVFAEIVLPLTASGASFASRPSLSAMHRSLSAVVLPSCSSIAVENRRWWSACAGMSPIE
jgi:hypothetical protein